MAQKKEFVDTKSIRPSEIKAALKVAYKMRKPAFIWGPPGVGKSDCVKQVARELGIGLQDIRTTLLDPVDLRGLPSVAAGVTKWNPPIFMPTEGYGILFLDELNACPPLVQAACYQLILDRKLGEYELPEGWVCIAAGNRETDRAVTHKMPTPLANRFMHLYFAHDTEDWVKWAMEAGVASEVISFIRYRPELLFQFDPSRSDIKAFPTPRSWEVTSKAIQAQPERNILETLIEGTVGSGAANEFIGFMRVWEKMPDPMMVLAHPETAVVPTDVPTLYALCMCLARKAGPKTFAKIFPYAKRLTAEFNVLLIKDAAACDRSIIRCKEFLDWVKEHKDVYLD